MEFLNMTPTCMRLALDWLITNYHWFYNKASSSSKAHIRFWCNWAEAMAMPWCKSKNSLPSVVRSLTWNERSVELPHRLWPATSQSRALAKEEWMCSPMLMSDNLGTVLVTTVLYCTVYCTILYCTAQYCTVLHCSVLYRIILYCAVLYCIVQ